MTREEELRKHRCCFTGHRPEKLRATEEEAKRWLEENIRAAIDRGYTTFITGMAMGVDIWAGEIVVRLRQEYPFLHLIAVTPWGGFAARWKEEWKNRYYALLKKADLVKVISEKYSDSIFEQRNRWMVDHASLVLAYYNGENGGTRNTIDYAQLSFVQVIVRNEAEESEREE